MKKIVLQYPRKLVTGEESFGLFLEDYASLGFNRLFILTVPALSAQVQDRLEPLRQKGIEIGMNTDIVSEPSFADFEKVLAAARDFNADSIAGIGGGSVMDTAKLVAAQLRNSQSVQEVKGIGNLKERATWLACIPTTAGTGSEVSPNALFVDETGAKIGVISPYLVPDAAYIDPDLTVSVPPAVTASTGIDALAHCMEAYANRFAHPVVDLYAREGMRLIARYLRRAFRDGSDKEARAQVALGSMYGGMCLGPVNTAAVHALSYPLGVTYHIPHGVSIALLLPYVMEFNLEAAPERYADIAQALGAEAGKTDLETAREGVRLIRQLIADCQLPSTLEELGIPSSAIESLAKDAMNVRRLLKNNLRVVTEKDARAIYQAACKG